MQTLEELEQEILQGLLLGVVLVCHDDLIEPLGEFQILGPRHVALDFLSDYVIDKMLNIKIWSLALLALFNVQYDYKVPKSPIDTKYVSIAGGMLKTCIYPGDRTFKKGSPTYPRSELRLKEEQSDGVYNFTVELLSVDVADGMDYSVWQLFGNGPLVMARKRFGKNQMVVFQGEPKFTPIETFPKWCSIKCGPKGYVVCPGVQSYGDIDCGDSLHVKIGIYAQQMDPNRYLCSTYGAVAFNKVNASTCIC